MIKEYADIIVDISHEKVDRAYRYHIPERLQGKISEGMCVEIPFGKGNKRITGYVVDLKESPDYDPTKIKDLYGIMKDSVSVLQYQMQLAAFLKHNYGSTMIQALKTVLPAKQSVKPLEKKTIKLNVSVEEASGRLAICLKKHQVAKARILKELLLVEELPLNLVTSKLSVGMSTLNSLREAGIIAIEKENSLRNPVKLRRGSELRKTMSDGQRHIVDTVLQDYDNNVKKTYLIHGITGSGKTEVYMNLIEGILARGKQAIVLIPEIALTYQTLLRFYTRFGDRVSVINSSLSAGEKYDQCERAKRGEIDIIIGPRSALFTPFQNIGLIIIDEEHEGSYKSESSPKYHARELAMEVARLHHASVILGSATPSVDAYFHAMKGEYTLFTLKERLTGGTLPTVYTVDLREELKSGNRSIFSEKLLELMRDRLQKKQQIMLFLNRRGYAGFVSCRSCGHVMKCPHCDVSLSEHKGYKLICHYCGYEQNAVKICPECGSKYISGFKAGTQQIEDKVKEIFKDAKVLRMDADTTKTKDSYEKILSSFSAGEADILIGTQMIVKGHDFPNVTLVGILAADLSLSVSDYRASEKTFALLTQAAGRAGRGSEKGEVVIQTYQPEHYSIVHAANQDYESFYEEEILYRELLRYPPVCHMMAVQVFSAKEEEGEKVIGLLADIVKKMAVSEQEKGKILQCIGPAPAMIGKMNDIFRFVFYVKFENYDKLVEIKDYLEEKVNKLQLPKVTMQIDFDPMNAF